MKPVFFVFVFLFVGALGASPYKGHEVWRVKTSQLHAEEKKDLDATILKLNLDVWSSNGARIDVQVAPDQKETLLSQINEFGVEYDVMIKDVQKVIDDQAKSMEERPQTAAFNFSAYHPFQEIVDYLIELDNNSTMATLGTIGQSIEGREQYEMKISTGPAKPSIWIDCGIHAREWVSPATCLFGLDLLTGSYGVDPTVTQLLDTYDFYIVPVYNPDGYNFTWSDFRLWRKNRRVNYDNDTCYGVDLNRNFDDHWGTAGSSADPCDNTYHGASPASEPETQNSQNRFASLISTANLASIYTLHSYGQIWLYAYGWTNSTPPDYDYLVEVAAVGVNATESVNGLNYDQSNMGAGTSQTAGTTVDYGYAQGISLTYLIELRDEGQYGFLLPEDQIIPNAQETWAGMMAAILYM